MKIFAIELSSRFGSIALVENGEVVAEQSWEENFKNRQQLFDAMAAMDVDWDGIDVYAVGRGPGAFSGLRIGFSVANSLAAPDGKPVYALNSGASLASRFGAGCTAVVGDARRNQVWAGLFNGTNLEKEFELMDPAALRDFVSADALVVSPDHDRLEPVLGGFKLLEGALPVYPSAGELGCMVTLRIDRRIDSEPPEPLYMHPPVFVEPRFA